MVRSVCVDDTLRTLARSAHHEPEARAAELRARLRAGRLELARLAVAAELGDTDAVAVTGVPPLALPDDLRAWLRLAERWGWPLVIRALVAAVESALPRARDPLGEARLEEARARLRAALAWCESPSRRRAEEAFAAAGPEPLWSGWNVLAAPVYAGQMPLLAEREGDTQAGAAALRNLAGITLRTLVETGAPEEALRVTMRQALQGWATRPSTR